MTKKTIIIWGVIILLGTSYVFRMEIEDKIECWAYYDQCTAEHIEGLTREECIERDDNVAYLLNDGICLVHPK